MYRGKGIQTIALLCDMFKIYLKGIKKEHSLSALMVCILCYIVLATIGKKQFVFTLMYFQK